jgi:hypothetical protein
MCIMCIMCMQTFIKPIRLEFEKVYCPLLLITKKRYAGVKFMDPGKPGWVLLRRPNTQRSKLANRNVDADANSNTCSTITHAWWTHAMHVTHSVMSSFIPHSLTHTHSFISQSLPHSCIHAFIHSFIHLFSFMDTTGIETVRRDNCELVRSVMTEVLDRLLMRKDVPGAIAYVKQRISDLLQNKVDLSMLIISKGFTRKIEEYDNKQGHIYLAEVGR